MESGDGGGGQLIFNCRNECNYRNVGVGLPCKHFLEFMSFFYV